MSDARIAPLEPPYSEAVTAALQKIMPPGVDPLVLFRTLAVNERVFLRLMAGGLLDRGSITLREREIVIDRTCARCGSEYESGVHVAFSRSARTCRRGKWRARVPSPREVHFPRASGCSTASSTSSTTRPKVSDALLAGAGRRVDGRATH